MKKKSPKLVATLVAVLTFANVFSLTGCGKTENTGSKAEQEVSFEISKIEQEVTSAQTDASVQTDVDTVQTQTDEQGVGTGGIMRAYSDKEKERMAGLQQSYQNETAKPEQMIQEVDSAEAVTEGTLCYIVSTGEYYLPDRELTDEELLEIIDCNFRISLNTNRKTQAEYEAEDRAKRAELEAKVKRLGVSLGVLMTPQAFVRRALKRTFRGKAQYINGLLNRVSIVFVASLPEWARSGIKHRLLDKMNRQK